MSAGFERGSHSPVSLNRLSIAVRLNSTLISLRFTSEWCLTSGLDMLIWKPLRSVWENIRKPIISNCCPVVHGWDSRWMGKFILDVNSRSSQQLFPEHSNTPHYLHMEMCTLYTDNDHKMWLKAWNGLVNGPKCFNCFAKGIDGFMRQFWNR